MLVIQTTDGIEMRIPVSSIDSIHEIEPQSEEIREVPPHPYLHREGVNRCAACWRPRTDASHSDVTVHER